MFDEVRFNCLFTLNFTQLWEHFVDATNQCCTTPQNSTCHFSWGVCRSVSRHSVISQGGLLDTHVCLGLLLPVCQKGQTRISCSHEGIMPAEPQRNHSWLPCEWWGVQGAPRCLQATFVKRSLGTCCMWVGEGKEESEPGRSTAVPFIGISECRWMRWVQCGGRSPIHHPS